MSNQMKWFMVWQLLMAVGIIFALAGPFSDEPDDAYKGEIEGLSQANEQLREANRELDAQVSTLKLTTDSLEWAITEIEVERMDLKENRDETIRSIDGMDGDKLFGFFSEFGTASGKN